MDWGSVFCPSLNAPNPRTAKITQTSLCDKGIGDKVLQKKYSHRSSLQTNLIQVQCKVGEAEGEVNPLQRGGHNPPTLSGVRNPR